MEEADIDIAINTIKERGGKIRQKTEPPETISQKKGKKKNDKDKIPTKIKVSLPDGRNGEIDESSESSSSESDSDSDFDENEHYPYKKQKNVEKVGYEEVPASMTVKTKKRPILTPEELALGQELITSKKRRRELEDAAWNRYMFDDKDK